MFSEMQKIRLNGFPINQAEPVVRNKRVTPVGLSSVLHKALSVVSGSEKIQNCWDSSPVICSIDWCPCVGPDSSIYVPLPKMTHRNWHSEWLCNVIVNSAFFIAYCSKTIHDIISILFKYYNLKRILQLKPSI